MNFVMNRCYEKNYNVRLTMLYYKKKTPQQSYKRELSGRRAAVPLL